MSNSCKGSKLNSWRAQVSRLPIDRYADAEEENVDDRPLSGSRRCHLTLATEYSHYLETIKLATKSNEKGNVSHLKAIPLTIKVSKSP